VLVSVPDIKIDQAAGCAASSSRPTEPAVPASHACPLSTMPRFPGEVHYFRNRPSGCVGLPPSSEPYTSCKRTQSARTPRLQPCVTSPPGANVNPLRTQAELLSVASRGLSALSGLGTWTLVRTRALTSKPKLYLTYGGPVARQRCRGTGPNFVHSTRSLHHPDYSGISSI